MNGAGHLSPVEVTGPVRAFWLGTNGTSVR
jgi:hypothetical protein